MGFCVTSNWNSSHKMQNIKIVPGIEQLLSLGITTSGGETPAKEYLLASPLTMFSNPFPSFTVMTDMRPCPLSFPTLVAKEAVHHLLHILLQCSW